MTPTIPTIIQALRERTFDEKASWQQVRTLNCTLDKASDSIAVGVGRAQFTADQKIIEKLCRALELADTGLEHADTALADSALADNYKTGALHRNSEYRERILEILQAGEKC